MKPQRNKITVRQSIDNSTASLCLIHQDHADGLIEYCRDHGIESFCLHDAAVRSSAGNFQDLRFLAPPGVFRTGWPRAVARPGLPQTRTCAINAFGSSSYPFATPRYTEWTARR